MDDNNDRDDIETTYDPPREFSRVTGIPLSTLSKMRMRVKVFGKQRGLTSQKRRRCRGMKPAAISDRLGARELSLSQLTTSP